MPFVSVVEKEEADHTKRYPGLFSLTFPFKTKIQAEENIIARVPKIGQRGFVVELYMPETTFRKKYLGGYISKEVFQKFLKKNHAYKEKKWVDNINTLLDQLCNDTSIELEIIENYIPVPRKY